MLELVIAVVVAFVVGLLIGVTGMSRKTRDLETKIAVMQAANVELTNRVYSDVNFQSHLIWCGPLAQQENLTNTQRKRLRRLGSKLLRIKDKDEDHHDSVEGQ